ncbi:MAG: N-acetyl-gamma-glutamyl-phosphate reductase [Acidobacteriaceae bacterium]
MSILSISAEANTKTTQPRTTAQTAVVGVSGYAGGELARLLLHHPKLASRTPIFLGRMEEAGAEKSAPVLLTDLQPQLAVNSSATPIPVVPFRWELLAEKGVEVLFLATPHEQSREWVPQAVQHGIRVVDLSGAWRLQNEANRAVYKLHDADPAAADTLQKQAVFGCPELHREEIATAKIVANPGCYSTSIILALAPLVRAGLVDLDHGIICDSKSGVSGAGKAPSAKTHFMYAADNLSAYAVFGHRHTGELLEQLQLTSEQIQFTPHLLPIPRGILSTIYLRLKEAMKPGEVEACLKNFYAESPLVRVQKTPHLPQIQYIVRTNYCDLGFELAKDGRRLVLVSCLDNLLKGAAGQAVQNMNVMYGWNEAEGLL